MDINIKELETKFAKAMMELEKNISFLESARSELSNAKISFDDGKTEFERISNNLQDSIKETEKMREDLVNRFKSEVKAIEDLKVQVSDNQKKSFDEIENKHNGIQALIKKEIFDFRKELIVVETKFNMNHERLEKSLKEADDRLVSKIDSIKGSIEGVNLEINSIKGSVVRINDDIKSLNTEISKLKEDNIKLNKKMMTMFIIAIVIGIAGILLHYV